MKIRIVKTTSKAKAVQVVRYQNNKRIVLQHIGSAHTEEAKKDAIIIFSYLDFDSGILNPALSLVINSLRKFGKETISRQYLPWLRIDKKFNRK